jgi:hypothetical protein
VTTAQDIATMMKIEQLELFKNERGLTYSQAAELFDRFGVWSFIDDAYEGLHVQGAWATFEDINTFLNHRES